MIPTTAEAVAASVAVARGLGLPHEHPVVVAEGYSVRVRLDPAPVLTRVVTEGRTLRGDPGPWMRRELAAARFLAGRGAPVVAPWTAADGSDPGVRTAPGGLEVTLWAWHEPVPDAPAVDPATFGRLLGELHGALAGLEDELPVLVGPLTDVATALRTSDDALLHEAAAELVPAALGWPRRPLHGDAHLGNLLATADGPRWIDLEDVCCGPPEWDLASRTLTAAHVAAYPGPVDHHRLAGCRDLRTLQVLAAILTDDVQDAGLVDDVRARLRARVG